MRLFFVILWTLTTANLTAAVTVTGSLKDGTADGPGAADQVVLFDLRKGMVPLKTLTSVTGSFELTDEEGVFEPGRYMVQAIKGSVFYSTTVTDENPIEITVYENSEEVDLNARVGSLALYAYEGGLDVGVFYNLDNVNTPNKTLVSSGPTFTFPLIPGGSNLEASTARGTMPLKQNLTINGGMASMSYPLKPGRTQLMVRTSHAYNGDQENEYILPLLPKQEFIHVLVLPMGMKVAGDGLEFVKPDQQNGVDLFEFTRAEGQEELRITISGKAPPRGTETADQSENRQASDGHSSGLEIKNTPAFMSGYRWYLLCGILALFGVLVMVPMKRA